MPKIWLLSDLHQEFMREPVSARDPETYFDPSVGAPRDFDVVVLAGDIEVPLTRSLQWAGDRFPGVQVVYVPGNHDFYTGENQYFTMQDQLDAGFELADKLGIHLLADRTAVISDVMFIGATLWTDFMSVGRGEFRSRVADASGRYGMQDYRLIKRPSSSDPTKRRRFRPEDSIAAHKQSRAFIEDELAKPFAGAKVVVSHHAPLPASLDSRYNGELDFCYASNLEAMVSRADAPDMWVHGHIHQARDYLAGKTRVVANPRGYQFEPTERNNGFRPELVLEVPNGPPPVGQTDHD